MIDYIRSLGIDVTSEYTYRELDRRADDKNHPIHRFYGDDTSLLEEGGRKKAPIRTAGRIPAVWWLSNMLPEDYIRYPAEEYTGLPMFTLSLPMATFRRAKRSFTREG